MPQLRYTRLHRGIQFVSLQRINVQSACHPAQVGGWPLCVLGQQHPHPHVSWRALTFKDLPPHLPSGILITGCQSHETSADSCPAGKPHLAFGALTNAIATTLKHNPAYTYRDLVHNVRPCIDRRVPLSRSASALQCKLYRTPFCRCGIFRVLVAPPCLGALPHAKHTRIGVTHARIGTTHAVPTFRKGFAESNLPASSAVRDVPLPRC